MIRFLIPLLILNTSLQAADVPPEVQQSENDRIALVGKITPSVVAVLRINGPGGGSGVIVSPDGYALTNFHVTSSVGDVMQCGLNDGKLYPGVIVGIDPTGDVALVKLQGRDDFPHSPMGDSDKLKVGQWVLAMGNPFTLAIDFRPTVTFGIISGLHRYQYPGGSGLLEYPDCIQTDASINPGNSGGPLFNLEGEVIGINGRISFEKRVRVNSGFGYAISINQIKRFFHALKGGRIVDHATLGATLSTDEDGRPIIQDLLTDSDAYRRGLQIGDEVVSFGGRKITTVNEFKNVLGTIPAGWRVPLVILRGKEEAEVTVRLSPLHGMNWDFYGDLKKKKKQKRRPGRIPPVPPGPDQLPRTPGESPEYAALRKSVEKKKGFANYKFNKLEQERILNAFTASLQKKKKLPGGNWQMRGHAGRVPFIAKVGEDAGLLKIGDMDFVVEKEDLFEPVGDDGIAILRSFQIFRSLVLKGREGFRGFYYEGQAPGTLGMAETAMGILGPIQVRCFFDQDTGALLEFEVSFERNADPYEFILGDTSKAGGLQLPHVFLVRVGDEFIGKFSIRDYEFADE